MELTFGQKAVGLTFNHAQGEMGIKVNTVKQTFADVIDLVGDPTLPSETRQSWLFNVCRTTAITSCIAAQMAVVKFITWVD
jgi:hypothetical protein